MRRRQFGHAAAWLLIVTGAFGMAPVTPARDPDVKRAGTASISLADLEIAAKPGAKISIRLFDDTEFLLSVVNVERREGGGLALQGCVVGDDTGTFSLTFDHDLISAGFWTRRGCFGLLPSRCADTNGNIPCVAQELTSEVVTRCGMVGAHSLHREDAARSFDLASVWPTNAACTTSAYCASANLMSGVEATSCELAHVSERPTWHSSVPGPAPRGGGVDGPRGSAACGCADDQATVDMLVVYTSLARDGAGGAASLQARVQNAIDSTNGALLRSGFSVSGVNRLRIQLAGFVEVAYAEQSPPPTDWIEHLQRVTDVGDGYLDDVHSLRDQFHADLVCLVIDDPRFTGGAAWWAPYSDALGFSCLNWRGMGGGNLTMAHEVGHNFGLAHEREVDSAALFDSAYAYWFNAGGTSYGTIMSYAGANFLPYYSNPTIVDPGTGYAVGAALSATNASWGARIIQQTRWTLANFRASGRIVDCNGNGISDTTDIAGGTSIDANGNGRPDECEVRWYVDGSAPGEGSGTSWNDCIKQLANGTTLASLPCSNVSEFWVAGGMYKPDAFGSNFTGDRYADFTLRCGLDLFGGFQGRSRPGGGEASLAQRPANPNAFPSILSGEIGNQGLATDNSYSVVTAVHVPGSSTLDGFTIERGYADWSGGGLYAEDAQLSLANCRFQNNRSGSGGGVYLNASSYVAFANSTFENNTAAFYGGGGIGLGGGSTAIVNRCTFRTNAAAWGGAMSSGDGSTADIRSSTFNSNSATVYNGGALDFDRSFLTLANSLLYGNTSTLDGGAIWTANTSIVNLTNCTIASNAAGTYTGGLVAYFDAVSIANSIFWNNTGIHAAVQDRQLVYFGATGSTRYSRVQGWTGLPGALNGPGNSGADPMFTSAAAGNYTLRAGSPAIDAGDTGALLSVPGAPLTLDVLGSARRVNDPTTADAGLGPAPIVDIGAAEFQVPVCRADFNHDGGVNSQDFFDFLAAFFSAQAAADFNADGAINSQDFFDFLAAFFSGC